MLSWGTTSGVRCVTGHAVQLQNAVGIEGYIIPLILHIQMFTKIISLGLKVQKIVEQGYFRDNFWLA